MRLIPRWIARVGLLAVSTAALWSLGPVWRGVVRTEQAFAQTQIQELGQELALQSYYDVASSAQVSAGGYGGPGHSGGAGDALVRVVNTGGNSAASFLRGSLCGISMFLMTTNSCRNAAAVLSVRTESLPYQRSMT